MHTKLKVTEKQLAESLTNVTKAAGEITNLKMHLQVEKDLVIALKVKYNDFEQERSAKPAAQK